MSRNQELSTQSRILIGWMLLITIGLFLALPFESLFAKRPSKAKEKPAAPVVEPDTSSVYDTTVSLPSPGEFVPVEVVPEMIYQEKPIYPPDAKAAGITGEMWVKAGVDMRGVVRAVMVNKSSGNKSLDDAALAAAWKCKYKPGIQNGKPVGVWVTYQVKFSDTAVSAEYNIGPTPQSQDELDSTLPDTTDSIVVDTQPEMIYQQPPVYPREAKLSGQTGTVWIKVLVDKLGSVRDVEIHKGSGHTSLDNATKAAAWKNRFKPAKKNGQPVEAWITYKVDFTLKEGQ